MLVSLQETDAPDYGSFNSPAFARANETDDIDDYEYDQQDAADERNYYGPNEYGSEESDYNSANQ